MSNDLYFVYKRDCHDGTVRLREVYITMDQLIADYRYGRLFKGETREDGIHKTFGTSINDRTSIHREVFGFLEKFSDYKYLVVRNDVTIVRPETLLGYYRQYHESYWKRYRCNWNSWSKRKNGRYYRHPRTLQERSYHANWIREDLEPRPRGSRMIHNLPDTYDDLRFSYVGNNNWKRYRKTRWK